MIAYWIKKRKITLLFLFMALIFGFFNFLQLPRQVMPDMVVKQAMVTTVYPGASPEKVEQTVTKIIEQKINEVENIKTITSSSMNGFSSILVEAEPDADAAAVWDEMRKKVQDAQVDLPEEAHQPFVNDELTRSFIEQFAIRAESLQDLYVLHELMMEWRSELRTVPGVAGVEIKGLPEREVRVELNADKLKQYGIPWEQVMNALQKENERIPTGSIDYHERTYQLIVPESQNAEDLRSVLVTRTPAGVPVYMRDIGDITYTFKEPEYFAYAEGDPVLTISVFGKMNSDVPNMTRLVNEKMDSLKGELPDGMQLESLYAEEDLVNELFAELSKEMMIAIGAVLVICTLGLTLLTSFTVALAIPISIGLSFIFLPALGISLNQISIVGYIIVLGILVDDAVVVNDNIERRRTALGENSTDAAVNGTKEVAVSILTATLATIAAFAPLLFLQGDVGSFIKPIPIVISLSMLASMLMSLSIIPIFREWYDKRRAAKSGGEPKAPGLLGRQIEALTNLYARRWMPRILKRPLLTGLCGLLIGTSAYLLILLTPIELFPDSERPEATINVTMPVGTSLAETDRVVREIAEWVSEQPETERIAYAAGGGAPTLFSDVAAVAPAQQATVGQLSVLGVKGLFDREITVESWMKQLTAQYPQASISIRVPQLGIPVGKPVNVRISGTDLNELQRLSGNVKEIIAAVPGTVDIQDDMGMELYNLTFEPDKEAMDTYMVSYNDLTRTLLLIGNGMTIGTFDSGKELIDINLYMEQTDQNPNALYQQLQITNAAGEQIPLSQVTDMKPGFSIQKVNHYNMARSVTITADLEGRTATEVMTEVSRELAAFSWPEGYEWETGGETSVQQEIFADLGQLGVIVILIIFLLITIQFYSMSLPLLVMTTVYLAAAGGVIGIFITGMPVGFMSIMGIISLAGIVVRNGIVLIEFIEDARREGTEMMEAVLAAVAARFRPILLTSLTAIVGMIPIATIGDILFRPLAATIIFGLMFSTVLTLFVVPSLYVVLARIKLRRQRHKAERSGAVVHEQSMTT